MALIRMCAAGPLECFRVSGFQSGRRGRKACLVVCAYVYDHMLRAWYRLDQDVCSWSSRVLRSVGIPVWPQGEKSMPCCLCIRI